MATYTSRTKTEVYQEIAVPLPSNVTELEKALGAARARLVPGTEWDNTFTVVSDGDELVIRWASFERSDPASEAVS